MPSRPWDQRVIGTSPSARPPVPADHLVVVHATQVLEEAALGDGEQKQPDVDEEEHPKVETGPAGHGSRVGGGERGGCHRLQKPLCV